MEWGDEGSMDWLSAILTLMLSKANRFFRKKKIKRKRITSSEDKCLQAFRFFYELSYDELYLSKKIINSSEFNKIEGLMNTTLKDANISTLEVRWTLFRNLILESKTKKEIKNLLHYVEKILNIEI